jgi:hypothetical protein
MAGGNPRDPQDDDRDWSAREIARRNRESVGKPLSPVMKTAATACELAHSRAAMNATAAPRPRSVRSGSRTPAD